MGVDSIVVTVLLVNMTAIEVLFGTMALILVEVVDDIRSMLSGTIVSSISPDPLQRSVSGSGETDGTGVATMLSLHLLTVTLKRTLSRRRVIFNLDIVITSLTIYSSFLL